MTSILISSNELVLPSDRIVEIDSYQVLDYLGEYEPRNESTKRTSPPQIMPQYYLIELKSNSDSSDSFLIISSATKTASEIMQNHLNDSYTAVKMCDYLRHMSENEEKLVSKYWDEHPEERDAIFLHYCINDIYIDGMSRYSVFQPVDVFVGTILTAIISILLFARIINGLHPSLLRFLAPTWIKHDLHRKI